MIKLFIVAIISLAVGFSLGAGSMKDEADKMFLDEINSDLKLSSEAVDILSYMQKNKIEDTFMEKKLKYIVFPTVISMKIINPDIAKLNALDALSNIIEYNDKYGFEIEGHKEVSMFFGTYLASIKDDVNQRVLIRNSEMAESLRESFLKPKNSE